MLTLFHFEQPVFIALVALTLLGPLLLAALLARWPDAILLRGLSPFTVLPALLLAFGPRLEVHSPNLVVGVRLGVDDPAAIFLLFSAILWGCAGWFGLSYLAHDAKRARYTIFFLMAQAGNLGLILAQDIATFYFCFALMSFSSYVLVVHDGQAASNRAGRIYLSLAILGEVLQFIAFSIIATKVPDARLADVPAAVAASPFRNELIVLLLASLGIKAGLVPLHVWLPLAHPVAPTPASAVLSGAMIKAGLLGWLRFVPFGLTAWPEAGHVLIALGLLGSLGGAVVGVTQRHPKAVLAYSSISQMGLIIVLVGIGLATSSVATYAALAAMLYALHHGLAKGLLFLSVGLATSAPGGARGQKAVLAGCVLAGLSLAGAPWTSGMLAKTALKKVAGLAPGDWPAALGWMLSLAAVGTTLLMARFLVRLRALQRDPVHHHAVAPAIWWPWTVLLLAVLAVSWWAVPELTRPHLGKFYPWWKLTWPILLGVGVAVAVGRWRRDARPFPEVPAGDILSLYGGLGGLAMSAGRRLLAIAQAAILLTYRWQEAVVVLAKRDGRRLDRAEGRLADMAIMGLLLLTIALWLGIGVF